MRSKLFDMPYSEAFAGQCIMGAFPELGWSLKVNDMDPPDLEDKAKGVGVEVTRVIAEKDAEAEKPFSRYVGAPKEAVPKAVIRKIENTNNKFFYRNERGEEKLFAVLHGAREIDNSLLKKRIADKTEKLNKTDYPNCGVNALFLDETDNFFFEYEKPEIEKCVRDIPYSKRFDFFFIYCDHDIFLFDSAANKWKARIISDEQIKSFQRSAHASLGRCT